MKSRRVWRPSGLEGVSSSEEIAKMQSLEVLLWFLGLRLGVLRMDPLNDTFILGRERIGVVGGAKGASSLLSSQIWSQLCETSGAEREMDWELVER